MRYFKLTYIIIVNYLLIGLLTVSNAQTSHSSTNEVIVDLVVQDTNMLDSGSIRFEMSRNGINSNMSSQSDVYEIKIDRKETRLIIPLSTAINYGRINYFFKGQQRLKPFDEAALSRFIFEQGDTLQILINKDSFSFKGKDADKYTCLQNIHDQEIKEFSGITERFYKQKRYDQMLRAQKESIDSLYAVKGNILKSYREKINPEIYKLLLADNYGRHQNQLLGRLLGRIVSAGIRSDMDASVARAYHKWFDDSVYPLKEYSLLAKSFQFCDFLYRKEAFELTFFNSPEVGKYNFRYTFPQIFNRINKRYSEVILDKLNLLGFYQGLTKSEDAKSYLAETLAKMDNNVFKQALSTMGSNFSGKAFAFELQNQLKQTIKLSDFKGKLVIMDFWFTGCIGCKILAEQMKPIIKYYSKENDVVFITVSIDKNRETWLKSLKDETYSNKHEINLYTNGLGDRHPIIEHYNIHGYPTLLIISKDGNLISSSPPRPEKGKPEKAIAFKKIIEENR